MKKAKPWIEETLYVECPHCEEPSALGSDYKMFLPDRSYETQCSLCRKFFMVLGYKDDDTGGSDA